MKAFLAVCFSLALFVAGLLGTFRVNLLIYGVEEFNNAGAGFAVLMEGLVVGLVLAVGGAVLSVALIRERKTHHRPITFFRPGITSSPKDQSEP